MLRKTYIALGSLVCSWFAVGAIAGWKAPNLGIVDSFDNSGSGRHGYFIPVGGRSSSGSSGWGGGK